VINKILFLYIKKITYQSWTGPKKEQQKKKVPFRYKSGTGHIGS